MGDRGRKPASELATLPDESLSVQERPMPPEELTDEQAEEWIQVTHSLPADWFGRETLGMLAQYCRHIVAARRVAQLIASAEDMEPFDMKEYDTLLRMQEREGRALSSLATRMRITQQATYDKSKKKPKQGPKLWG